MKIKHVMIMLLLPMMLSGQQADRQKDSVLLSRMPGSTSVGVRTGVNFSKTSLRDFDLERTHGYDMPGMQEEALPIWSLSGGVSVHQQLTTNWFLSADILFERKGFRLELDIPETNNDDYGSFLFNYFSLPVMINVNSGGDISAYAGVGVYTSYLLAMYSQYPLYHFDYGDYPWADDPEVYYRGDFKYEETAFFERFDFGLAAQAGVVIPLEECFEMDFQAAYSYGLLSALDPKKDFYRNTKHYHRTLMISLGFRFLF